MENLPAELQELIFFYLSGDTLLKACCVSKQWNLIISNLDRIWHKKCEYIGSGPVKEEIENWKDFYIVIRRKLHALKKDLAFKTNTFVPEAMNRSTIRGLAYSQNHLLIGNHNRVYLIRVSDQEIISEFQVPYKLSFLTASEDGFTIGIGQHNGLVTSWRLEIKKEIKFEKLREYQGHTSEITCLCVKPKSGLLCSSSSDRSVCLWQLNSGDLLWTLNCHNKVQNVILVQSETHALILKDGSNIRRFSWSPGHVHEIQELKPVISAKGTFAVKTIYLSYQTSGGIVVADWRTGKQLYFFSLCYGYNYGMLIPRMVCQNTHSVYRHVELIAMGTRFILALLVDANEEWYKVGIFDMLRGRIVGNHPITKLDFIIAGETAWLNGLDSTTNKDELVYAAIHNFGGATTIQFVKWKSQYF